MTRDNSVCHAVIIRGFAANMLVFINTLKNIDHSLSYWSNG